MSITAVVADIMSAGGSDGDGETNSTRVQITTNGTELKSEDAEEQK